MIPKPASPPTTPPTTVPVRVGGGAGVGAIAAANDVEDGAGSLVVVEERDEVVVGVDADEVELTVVVRDREE